MLEKTISDTNGIGSSISLENIALSGSHIGILLKFRQDVDEYDALDLIGRLLAEFYYQELCNKPYFKEVRIMPGNPSKEKRSINPNDKSYVIEVNYRSHGKRQNGRKRALILGFFNIRPLHSEPEWDYELKFARRNDDFANESFSFNETLTRREVLGFYNYVITQYSLPKPIVAQSPIPENHRKT